MKLDNLRPSVCGFFHLAPCFQGWWVLQYVSVLLFWWPSNILLCGYTSSCVSTHQLIDLGLLPFFSLDFGLLPFFSLLCIKLLWTFIHKLLCEHIFLVLLELLSHMVRLCLTVQGTVKPVIQSSYPFYIPTSNACEVQLHHIHTAIIIVWLQASLQAQSGTSLCSWCARP